MKRRNLMWILATGLLMFACGGGEESTDAEGEEATTEELADHVCCSEECGDDCEVHAEEKANCDKKCDKSKCDKSKCDGDCSKCDKSKCDKSKCDKSKCDKDGSDSAEEVEEEVIEEETTDA